MGNSYFGNTVSLQEFTDKKCKEISIYILKN